MLFRGPFAIENQIHREYDVQEGNNVYATTAVVNRWHVIDRPIKIYWYGCGLNFAVSFQQGSPFDTIIVTGFSMNVFWGRVNLKDYTMEQIVTLLQQVAGLPQTALDYVRDNSIDGEHLGNIDIYGSLFEYVTYNLGLKGACRDKALKALRTSRTVVPRPRHPRYESQRHDGQALDNRYGLRLLLSASMILKGLYPQPDVFLIAMGFACMAMGVFINHLILAQSVESLLQPLKVVIVPV